MFLLLKSIVILLILASPTFAIDWYVRIDGHDTNCNGQTDASSASAPNCAFRTVQKGADSASGGDTVHVGPGTFYEGVTINTSGTIDNYITIEGQSDGSTIVDDSSAIIAGNWVPAPEVGTGVYKQTGYSSVAGSMYIVEDGVTKDFPRCNNNDCITGAKYMATATDATHSSGLYLGWTVNFWDGQHAVFTHDGASTLYVRFGDNSDPSTKTLRASNERYGEVFYIGNQDWIYLKNLTIRGAYEGIDMRSGASNIVIDNCTIYSTMRYKIYASGSSNIEIKNCTLYGSMSNKMGPYETGAWDDGSSNASCPYSQAIKEWIYYCYKYRWSTAGASGGQSDENDSGIYINASGTNIKIHDNTIYDSLIGIMLYNCANNVKVYNNTIYQMSSIGISTISGTAAEVYNNLVYDNNINLRFQALDVNEADWDMYVYNNRCYLIDDIGSHTWFHGNSIPSPLPKVKLYHNSFAGGDYAFGITASITGSNGNMAFRFLNNIFSPQTDWYNGSTTWYTGESDNMEMFGYNWVGANHKAGVMPAWDHEGNVDAQGTQVWDNSSMPSFLLPGGHAAEGSAIDITSSFTINSITDGPWPWDPEVLVRYGNDMGWLNQYTPTITGVTLQ